MPRKTVTEISAEWDGLARERARQIDGGLDPSLEQVLGPTVLGLAGRGARRALDVGCGVGGVTEGLARLANEVVAIDPSPESIRTARRRAAHPRVEYVVASVEQFAEEAGREFDLVVANMVLMAVPDLASAVRAIASLLAPGGRGVFSITHPWVWPAYWGYRDEPWFIYDSEIFIEAEFTTSRSRTGCVTTHVHRPLGMYAAALAANDLVITELVEPSPVTGQASLRPPPRFLVGGFTTRTRDG